MQINKPLTDDRVIELIREQLAQVTQKYAPKYNSAEELLGVLTEEYYEVIDAIRSGKGHVTSEVLGELIDMAVVCIRGARSYQHGGVIDFCCTECAGQKHHGLNMQWKLLKEKKPKPGQVCIISAGPDAKSQYLAAVWDEAEGQFYWVDDSVDPMPHPVIGWMLWPEYHLT